MHLCCVEGDLRSRRKESGMLGKDELAGRVSRRDSVLYGGGWLLHILGKNRCRNEQPHER